MFILFLEINIKKKLLGDFKRFPSRVLVNAIQENARESRKEFLLATFKEAAEQSSNVKKHQFWRHDNKPIELWSNKVITEKINYIHNNPVEAGYVFVQKITCIALQLIIVMKKGY
jgi:hypothetical protein